MKRSKDIIPICDHMFCANGVSELGLKFGLYPTGIVEGAIGKVEQWQSMHHTFNNPGQTFLTLICEQNDITDENVSRV